MKTSTQLKYKKAAIFYRLAGVLFITALIIFAIVIEETTMIEGVQNHIPTDFTQLEYGLID